MCANEILSSEIISKINPEQLKALEKQGLIKKNSDGTYVKIVSDDSIAANNKVKGTAVESSPTPVEKVETPQVSMLENKALQKAKTEQYQQEWLNKYTKDPQKAENDLLDTIYYKDVKLVEESLRQFAKNEDGGVLIKQKYLQEYASKDEIEAYENNVKKKLEYYKQNPDIAKDDYNNELTKHKKDNIIKKHHDMRDDQLLEIARRKALIDNFSIGNDKFKQMAKDAVMDKSKNIATRETIEYAQKIAKAEADGDTEKVAKLKAKAVENLKSSNNNYVEEKHKDIQKLAEMMGKAQVDNEVAKEKFEKTVVHWAKDPSINEKDGKFHNYLSKDLQEIVTEAPDLFATEATDGKGDFTGADGKKYYFDGNKYKQTMLELSNANSIDENGVVNNESEADYFASINEKKAAVDKLKYRTPVKDDNGNIVKDKDGNVVYKDGNVLATLKERNLAKNAFRTGGIETEFDATAWKRAGKIAKGFGTGAAIGAAVGTVSEFLSTTHGVSKDYAKVVNVAGSVLYSGTAGFSGSVPYTANGSVQSVNNFVSEVWDNGTLLKRTETEVINDIPWETTGSVDYKGQVNYSGSKDYTDSGLAEGTTHGKAKFNLGNVGIAAALGGVAGAVKAAKGIRKVFDEEDSKSRVRELAARNNNKPQQPVTPPAEETTQPAETVQPPKPPVTPPVTEEDNNYCYEKEKETDGNRKIPTIKFGGPHHYAQLYVDENGKTLKMNSDDFKDLRKRLGNGAMGEVENDRGHRILDETVTLNSGKKVSLMPDEQLQARIKKGFSDAGSGGADTRYQKVKQQNGTWAIYDCLDPNNRRKILGGLTSEEANSRLDQLVEKHIK